jgi:hypothetical protein
MIILPEKCFCDEECIPLSQMVSTDGESYLTVCERLSFEDDDERTLNDKYIVRFKNDQIDDVQYYDKRDLIDTISVLAQAVSVIENMEINNK